MKTWYLAAIKENISNNYFDITNIQKYAGKKVYVYKDEMNIRYYRGRLFSNSEYKYYWSSGCFSEIQEL